MIRRSRTTNIGAPRRALGLAVAFGALLSGCAPRRVADADAPVPGKRAEGRNGMVSASHPDASAAGLEMLRRGGNAVDAAVATAFALGVVDPSQTGLGGGGAALVWLRGARRAELVDFMAASGADPAWARIDTGSRAGARMGRGAAVPGTVAGLLHLLEAHGTLSRDVVLAPAIRLARDGFVVSPLLARTTASSTDKLSADSAAYRLFFPGGAPLQTGDRLIQPALAATLERIAREGRAGFYAGPVAERLSAKVRSLGGLITTADLRDFRPISRRPLCGRFAGQTVLSAPPSLSGAVVIEALHLFGGAVSSTARPAESPDATLALVNALRLADADRAAHRGDPDAMAIPARGITSPAYAAERATRMTQHDETAPSGDPWDEERAPLAAGCDRFTPFAASARPAANEGSPRDDVESEAAASYTSHLSVVDRDRNAVSLTFTVGVLFGSGVYTDGFFLNSSASNFDRRTAGTNRRNNSTMTPTLLLEGDEVRLVVGAAGSQYIPPAVVQTILHVTHYGRDVGAALAAPRLSPTRGKEVEIEPGFSGPVYAALRAQGYATRSRVADLMFGAVHAVQVRKDGVMIGAADPRRDGAAMGW